MALKKWTNALLNVHQTGKFNGQPSKGYLHDFYKNTLCPFAANLGVIDECFLGLNGFENYDLVAHAQLMRSRIKQWIGIPVCVGIGDTKTLAKLANHCAKKSLSGRDSVCDLTRLSDAERSGLFSKIDVGEVWGVGPRLSLRLREQGIDTVEKLRVADPKIIRREYSVVLERTVSELNGIQCMALEDVTPNKQQIMCSRSFGAYVSDLHGLSEAVASYVGNAAEKLRSQGSKAGRVHVFVHTNPFADIRQYSNSITIPLPEASDDTLLLTRAALWGLRRIYRQGYEYKKAGVMLMELTDAAAVQGQLFSVARDNQKLMATMDRINAIWGRGTLRSAAEGIDKAWSMKREKVTPAYTTRWDQLPVVG